MLLLGEAEELWWHGLITEQKIGWKRKRRYLRKKLLTKFRFLWNELYLLVLKYFGRMWDAKSAASKIPKAFPDSAHEIISWWSWGEISARLVSPSSISYSRLGNCCGTPRRPVRGYANVAKGKDGMFSCVSSWMSIVTNESASLLWQVTGFCAQVIGRCSPEAMSVTQQNPFPKRYVRSCHQGLSKCQSVRRA